jgi:hypothetical protein
MLFGHMFPGIPKHFFTKERGRSPLHPMDDIG